MYGYRPLNILVAVVLLSGHTVLAGTEIEGELGAPVPSIYCRHSTGWLSAKEIGDMGSDSIATLRARSAGCVVSTADATDVVNDMLAQVVDNYVYPTVARAMREQVMTALESGKIFEEGHGCFEFVDKVFWELFAACHDRHLSVCYEYDPKEALTALRGRLSGALLNPMELPKMAGDSSKTGIANVTLIQAANTVGYIKLTHFPGLDDDLKRAYKDAMATVESSDGLILDLRDNMGGNPDAVRHLIGYFLPTNTHVINTYYRVPGHFNYTTTEGVAGSVLGKPYASHKPVYILASKKTASAGEELCYDLQLQKRASIVGTPTWGGAHPVKPFSSLGRFSIQIPCGSSHDPATMDNWEVIGVQPDVRATPETALDVALAKLSSTHA